MLRKNILFCCLLLLLGCTPPVNTSPAAVVSPQVAPPVTPSATPYCQPAAGVTMELHRLGNALIVVSASGLEPGESPFIFYSTVGTGGTSKRGEAWGFAKGTDQHGDFSFQLGNLAPPAGQDSATWDVRLVHRRGVACATIVLP